VKNNDKNTDVKMKSVNHLVLTPGSLSLAQLREISRHKLTLELAPEAINDINTSAQIVQKVLDEGRTVYGINTGFGLLANTKIAPEDLQLLQRSIVLSHAAGTGQYMQDATVRLMMVLKINSLSRGFSGIRLEVINFLISLVNAEVYPCVPEKGSVGASGDLAPLAHMCLPLLGEGEMSYQGQIISAAEGLEIAGLKPIDLAAKEGLALLNGTQASTALALEGLFHAEDLFAASSVIGAMSVEAAHG
jgi:Histidine ammonia-lyase